MERREKNSNSNIGARTNSSRNKRPETDRYYRPSSSRSFDTNKNPESIKTAGNDKIKESVLLEPSNRNENKLEPSSNLDRTSQTGAKLNNSGNFGGVIKINKSTLDEIIAKNERLSISEDGEENNSKHFISKSSRTIPNTNDPSFNPQEYKTLFNPNNPNKPIYVKNNNQQTKTSIQYCEQKNLTNNNTNNNRENENHQNQESLSKIQPKSTNELARINKAQSLIKLIQQEEHKLKNLVDSFDLNTQLNNFISEINPIRKRTEELCIEALFTHLETSSNANIDVNHWRSSYHQLIESLRKETLHHHQHQRSVANNQNRNEDINKLLMNYIEEGFRFYNHLIDLFETKTLKFKISWLIDLNNQEHLLNLSKNNKDIKQINTIIKSKDMKYALICINRSLISLGDLARYKEMIFGSSSSLNSSNENNQRDYSVARSYYLKAMSITPKNSRSYHQLAIIAIYTKRRLDACYYYFRCLEITSNPITSVKQSLNSIFEEARVKSDSIVKMLTTAILNKRNKETKNNIKNYDKHRVEIWYKPSVFQQENNDKNMKKCSSEEENDESDEYDDEEEENKEEINSNSNEDVHIKLDFNQLNEKKLSINELNKRFMLNYLNIIGKLFTKVGMETYNELCILMLNEFKELLKREPTPLGRMRLLQITMINISIIDLIYKNNTTSTNQQLEHSIQLGIDMFMIMVKRFNHYLNQNLDSNVNFQQLFPSIKVFINWMLYNKNIWYPLPLENNLNLNRWQLICDMFNLLNKLQKVYENITEKEILCEYLQNIKLEEDFEVAGFSPLSTLPKEDYDYQMNINNLDLILTELNDDILNRAKNKKRIKSLCLFADYLCGLEEPILKYDVANRCYNPLPSIKINPKITTNNNNNRTTSTCSSSSIKSSTTIDGFVEKTQQDFDHINHSDDSDLNELKEKRNKLKAIMDEKSKMESLIEMNVQRRLELEIRPRFIIPDTNCFIDHLNLIDKILSSYHYIVVVPLLVINELDKLSKSISNYNDDSIEHAEYVQKSAKKAIKFLNEKFDKREKNLKALTSEGSVLETIQFRSEEVKKQGTTDELILGCCLHYCRDNARDFMPNNKSDAIHLFREVVLLTDDRHLKLKAHTRNVPVKNVRQFVKWSNL